jgi:hypothetical protein
MGGISCKFYACNRDHQKFVQSKNPVKYISAGSSKNLIPEKTANEVIFALVL